MRIIVLLLLLCSSQPGKATFQLPDVLITADDTLSLWCNPLESNTEFQAIRLQFGETDCHTACWRGYSATWTVFGNELYLSSITGCCVKGDSLISRFKQLHPEIGTGPGFKATWLNGDIMASGGPMIRMFHYSGYHAVHATEIYMTFTGGMLQNVDTVQHSKSLILALAENEIMLKEYILSKINWEPASDETKKSGIGVHLIFYWQSEALQGIVADCEDKAIAAQLDILFSRISTPLVESQEIRKYVWQDYVTIDAKEIKSHMR